MHNYIEDLCDNFNNTNLEWKPNSHFLNDINLILEEIKINKNLEIDIYDILISCGSNIHWNAEYFISLEDFNWFKQQGKTDFLNYINIYVCNLSDISLYNKALDIHNKLCNLFELQID